MSRKWRLALILWLLAILLWYLFVGDSLKHSSHCSWKDWEKKKLHKQAHDMKVKKTETKKKSQFMAWARDQISSITYAQLNWLEFFENDWCQFDDIGDESPEMKSMIEKVCQYRLLRGKNWSYLKNDIMTQTDMLVLLMRSKYGYLNENTSPWFKNYYNQAVGQGIVKPWLDLTIFDEELTLKDVSLWIQRMNKENDASRLLSQ